MSDPVREAEERLRLMDRAVHLGSRPILRACVALLMAIADERSGLAARALREAAAKIEEIVG